MGDDLYTKAIPHWMLIALGELKLGVAEVPGPVNNQRVIEYHSTTTLKATDDFVPWCSSYLCWVMECAHISSPRSAQARAWEEWGDKLITPKFGAVVVLKRGTLPSQGHVGFFLDQDRERIFVLGGNQEDRVSIRPYLKASLLSYRWPSGF